VNSLAELALAGHSPNAASPRTHAIHGLHNPARPIGKRNAEPIAPRRALCENGSEVCASRRAGYAGSFPPCAGSHRRYRIVDAVHYDNLRRRRCWL